MPADDTADREHAECEKGGGARGQILEGTPQVTECVLDFASPRETCSVLPMRYEVKQLWIETERPMVEC